MSAEPEGQGTALKGLEHLFPDEVPEEGLKVLRRSRGCGGPCAR